MATSRATVVPMKMAQMNVAQVSNPGADFRIVEREIPEPGAVDRADDKIAALVREICQLFRPRGPITARWLNKKAGLAIEP